MTGQRAVGVFGGSFNPPHLAHLAVASDVCAMLDLESVLFVPAAAPVHREVADDVPASTRLEMTALAVRGDERFSVSSVEIDLVLRYTLDVVAELGRRLSPRRLVFILGSDSLLQFGSWHQPSAILELCRVAVAARPGDDLRTVEEEARRWGREAVTVLPTVAMDISSSMIRERVRIGLPIDYLVPGPVRLFIRDARLYRGTAP